MQPGATALRFLGNTVTWAGLRDRVAALAGALGRRGVGPGDRVMVLMLNRTEFVESVLAANMIGAIAVPINFRLTPPEIAFLVERLRGTGDDHRIGSGSGGRRRPKPHAGVEQHRGRR